jgi:phosphoglycerate kinase
MGNKLSIRDLDISGNRILMRVDFNVPLDEKAEITDDARIRAALPSILHVLKDASLVLMSHLGRPNGQVLPEFSLAPCARRLAQLLNRPVALANDCVGPEVEEQCAALQPGEVLLLENLRFHAAETDPDSDPSFAEGLAQLGHCYVNDAFGTAHRRHSSTATVAEHFPGRAAAGLLMDKELEYFQQLRENPKRPFHAIVAGAKVSSKIGALKALLAHADLLVIGGGMAFTFLKAQGYAVGDSLVEDQLLSVAKEVLEEADRLGKPILLPGDIIAADAFSNDANSKTVAVVDGIPDGYMGLDCGPKTVERIKDELQKAGTILWNGPLGVFEFPNFAAGTQTIAKAIVETDATTIVGGGDSVAAVNELGLADRFSHVSTGGGASLEYIEFGSLPGIEALSPSEKAPQT